MIRPDFKSIRSQRFRNSAICLERMAEIGGTRFWSMTPLGGGQGKPNHSGLVRIGKGAFVFRENEAVASGPLRQLPRWFL